MFCWMIAFSTLSINRFDDLSFSTILFEIFLRGDTPTRFPLGSYFITPFTKAMMPSSRWLLRLRSLRNSYSISSSPPNCLSLSQSWVNLEQLEMLCLCESSSAPINDRSNGFQYFSLDLDVLCMVFDLRTLNFGIIYESKKIILEKRTKFSVKREGWSGITWPVTVYRPSQACRGCFLAGTLQWIGTSLQWEQCLALWYPANLTYKECLSFILNCFLHYRIY